MMQLTKQSNRRCKMQNFRNILFFWHTFCAPKNSWVEKFWAWSIGVNDFYTQSQNPQLQLSSRQKYALKQWCALHFELEKDWLSSHPQSVHRFYIKNAQYRLWNAGSVNHKSLEISGHKSMRRVMSEISKKKRQPGCGEIRADD